MKVIISAAGTGGHIYPAISIINKIKKMEPNSEIIYIGTTDRMEKDVIPKMGIKYIGINISGLSKNILKLIKSFFQMSSAIKRCRKIIKSFDPDIVIGVGGYVTVPVIFSANKLGYKTIIHEQNIIPGKANIFLNKYADKILVSLQESMKFFNSEKVVFTGNPRGEEVLNAKPVTKFSLGFDNKKLILITMGSLGSKTVNDIIANSFKEMSEKDYNVLFVTGDKYYDKYKYNKYKNIKIVSYLDNMPSVLKTVDLIITRAGATILSEITTLGVVPVLIPSPYVPNNHQYLNAMLLVEKEAGFMIEEKDLTAKKILSEIDMVLSDQDKYNKTLKNLKKLGTPNSLDNIYKEIVKLVGEKA